MQLVRESAHLYDNPTNYMGYGIPNFEDAYNALQILGIENEFMNHNFALYPNPVDTRVNVSFPKGISKAHFSLYNVLGELVMETEVTAEQNQVLMDHLKRGMYLASVRSEGKAISFKLIKN